MSEPAPPLLSLRDLRLSFATDDGEVEALHGVSFDVAAGTVVALVGESGCGKSITAHAIMRLLRSPPATIRGGEILFQGQDLLKLRERAMRKIRGAGIGLVFQDPSAALDPLYTIGAQLNEAYRLHRRMRASDARRLGIALLKRVGLPEPARRFDNYPHQLSGGMRQRVMIAIALASDPPLLIADEPTTALDMLAASQVTSLLADLKRERDMAMLLISHDILSVAAIADRVVVLYAGEVVETGSAQEVLHQPQHPYTRALLACTPPLRRKQRRRRATPTRLEAIGGSPPALGSAIEGCRFAPRCDEAWERCQQESPAAYALAAAQEARLARCFLVDPANDRDEAASG